MARPRIIIADTDHSYIVPLQHKFIEEFFEKIDLEIITEKSFFEQLFSTPQKIDMLIVSEELFSTELLKHSIGNIFIMTEQPADSLSVEPNVHHIYKYTSIKEIFNVITGKGTVTLNASAEHHKEPEIITVFSAAGGVGKTTIALGICAALGKNYKKVLYINAARLQAFQTLLSNPASIGATDVYAKLSIGKENIYPDIKHAVRNEGFSYLPPLRASLMSLGIDYSIYEKIAVSAQKSRDYDYVVIDADSVFDENKARLIDISNRVIIVTRQSKASAYATQNLVANINGVSNDKFVFVCNDFDEDSPNELITPDVINTVNVADYVGHLSNYDLLKASDLANNNEIQKIAFLIL